jgi:polyisoprenyl-phosphate glycosyltransferase
MVEPTISSKTFLENIFDEHVETLISIVSPVYQAENILAELIQRIKLALSSLNYKFEILLVDDGSLDKSWQKIVELSKTHPEIKGYKLSRNFGQHYAITAGLDQSQGEWIVVMDCDLQDRPE